MLQSRISRIFTIVIYSILNFLEICLRACRRLCVHFRSAPPNWQAREGGISQANPALPCPALPNDAAQGFQSSILLSLCLCGFLCAWALVSCARSLGFALVPVTGLVVLVTIRQTAFTGRHRALPFTPVFVPRFVLLHVVVVVVVVDTNLTRLGVASTRSSSSYYDSSVAQDAGKGRLGRVL